MVTTRVEHINPEVHSKVMAVVGNSLGAARAALERVKELKLPDTVVAVYAQNVERNELSNPHIDNWGGQTFGSESKQGRLTGHKLYHLNVLQSAKEEWANSRLKNVGVALDFAVNDDDASILRRCVLSGDHTTEEQQQAQKIADTVLNSYLVSQDLVNKEGILYEADEHGNIKVNNRGEPIKASDKLANLEQGLKDCFASQQITLGVTRVPFPTEVRSQQQAAQKTTAPQRPSAQPVEPNNKGMQNT